MRQLPPRQRQAVAYHYLAGLPYREVAAIVGGTAAAARRAAADGIAALRRSYLGVAEPDLAGECPAGDRGTRSRRSFEARSSTIGGSR